MKIKKMKIADLEINEENPRKIDKRNRIGLEQSIKRYGYLGGIVYNQKSKKIVGGNQKLSILKELGKTEVDVIVVNLNAKDEKALNLALNNLGIQGEFTEGVQDILEDLKANAPDLYDELRLFEIDFDMDFEEPNLDGLDEETDHLDMYQRMDLQPFEHYDYVVIMADNLQDWEFMREFFNLKKVDMSIGEKGKKIGIGRAVKAKEFIKKIKERK